MTQKIYGFNKMTPDGVETISENYSITKGDSLNSIATASVSPNWTYEADTFGLIQSQVVYKVDTDALMIDQGASFNDIFHRGASHPIFPYLYLHKVSVAADKGAISTITANYCGLDPVSASSGYTTPIVSMVGNSSSEDITHHPNFIRMNCTSIAGTPLAGPPPPAPFYKFDENVSTNPHRALWTPAAQNGTTVLQPQFVAFLPPADSDPAHINIKAGVRSYYKPQLTLRLTMYVGAGLDSSAADQAGALASYVGWTTNGSTFKLPTEYKKLLIYGDNGYPGNFHYDSAYEAYIHRSFLVTNVSMELFGKIYKVTADLMLSGIAGWDKDIYPAIQGET